MPIIIHRPDLDPKPEPFAYDKVVGVIVMVLVGLWVVGDFLTLLVLGSMEGFLSQVSPNLTKAGEMGELNRRLVVAATETVASGALFVLSAIGIRNSLRYGFWLCFPAGIVMIVASGIPIEERTFMQWVFALVAMGYSAWRLIGWAGPKPN